MNPYLIKIAKESDSPHHDAVLERLRNSSGVVAQHSMGSGKTLLALKAAKEALDKNPKKTVVISAPASVIKQFPEEAKKFKLKLDESRIEYYSHEELVNKAKDIASRKHSLLIVDEGHRLRISPTSKNKAHNLVRDVSDKGLVLSGTAMYNKPHDVAALVNLASGEDRLPESEAEFAKKYISTEKVSPGFFKRMMGVEDGEKQSLKNKKELGGILKEHVHNYDALESMPEEFAKTTENIHPIQMGDDQGKYYRFAEGNIPWHIRMKIRHGLPLSKKESSSLNAFSSAVRQISNTHASYTQSPDKIDASPKFKKMLEHSQELRKELGKGYRGVVYSNYLGSGLEHYSRLLKDSGVDHQVYHGGLSKTEKKKIVDDYNAGKFDTLLLSSSGAEGLNLKGVRHMQVMEPHWNISKIRQVTARAVRRGSHAHLAEKDRHVRIDHYHTQMPKTFTGASTGKSIEEYLYNMSLEKEGLKGEINKMIEKE